MRKSSPRSPARRRRAVAETAARRAAAALLPTTAARARPAPARPAGRCAGAPPPPGASARALPRPARSRGAFGSGLRSQTVLACQRGRCQPVRIEEVVPVVIAARVVEQRLLLGAEIGGLRLFEQGVG